MGDFVPSASSIVWRNLRRAVAKVVETSTDPTVTQPLQKCLDAITKSEMGYDLDPAYWRGQDAAVTGILDAIDKAFEGKAGDFGLQRLTDTTARIAAMRQRIEASNKP